MYQLALYYHQRQTGEDESLLDQAEELGLILKLKNPEGTVLQSKTGKMPDRQFLAETLEQVAQFTQYALADIMVNSVEIDKIK